MTYINTTILEGTVVEDLSALLTANGWTVDSTFTKVGYSAGLISSTPLPAATDEYDIAIAKHTIFKNADGALYGMAKVYTFREAYSKMGGTKPFNVPDNAKTMADWAASKYKNFGKDSILYFYMVEKKPAPPVPTGQVWHTAINYNAGVESIVRCALDVEVLTTVVAKPAGSAYEEYSFTIDETVFQSPFVKSTLRNSNLTLTDVSTNWWPDSKIRVQGMIDSKTVLLVIQADSTPAFKNNVVPSVPVFWGSFVSYKEGDTGNHALWAGTAYDKGSESQSHNFDFKSSTPYRPIANFLPMQKAYPNFPGNGVDNIIVKRSQLGSRYQAYYLSWNSAPQTMPPDRVGVDGGQYPLSWTTQENDEYKYKYNPSIYSGRVHTSRAYLMHPDEGVRGYLPKMVILAPIGLIDQDKLKVLTESCPDKYDQYRYFLPSAISPISKRPGTAFTPSAIGIFEKSI